MSAVGVDVGTTIVKAVGYDDAGVEAVVCRRPVPVSRPRPGWAEQDMREVWEAVVATVRGVVSRLASPPALLAVTGQGDGAWLVDRAGEPTGPAPLWNDGRAGDLLAHWDRDGTTEAFARITASRPSTGMAAPLVAWFRDHDPDRLARSRHVLGCGGWVFSRLTGETAGDLSGAVSFLDVRSGAYSAELLADTGLDQVDLLPELRADDERTAGIRDATAAALGVAPGTAVVLAPYDIAATAIGAGAVGTGQAACILGTTLCPETVVDRVPDRVATGITVPAGAPGRWLRAFPTMAGGDVLDWAARTLGTEDVGALLSLAGDSAPGAGGVTFLPYLSPAGERNPFTDLAARGSLHGLSFDADRADIARALLEGLTMTVRDCLAVADEAPESLALCGGGTASPAWVRLIADVTGLPVRRCADAEVGARGAVLVGEVALGSVPDLACAAERLPSAGEPVLPDPGRAARYDEAYDGFVRLRDQVRATWRGDR